ncbi:MAG: flagellar hook-basal body complex protein [Verrucomicrobiota bacterium]|nr:flagellar hook-basal body complex protein [Verrucomicrobiota bacterium]
MLRSLNSGVSGIQQFQTKLDVIGNNISNSNTIAYKSAHSTFADAFSQKLQGGAGPGGSLQVGSGVTTSAIKNDFSRGSYTNTHVETNLYIDGEEGFFILKDLGGVSFASRAGDFVLQDGYLVNNAGLRVQGYNDLNLSTYGDVRIDDDIIPPATEPTHDPDAKLISFKILSDGRVRVKLSDDREYDRGQVLMTRFGDPQMLEKEGGNLFSNVEAARPLENPAAPGSNGMGTLVAGALEMSNVDLANEFASLITTQRGFQASARIITTSDELLQEVVNLKR